MLVNQNTYKVNPDIFFIGGHSAGGGATLFSIYVDKDEVASDFPSNFYTDNRYIDLNLFRNKIKCVFPMSGALTDISYIDADETTPIFMYHGTHDPAAPFYIGAQFCDQNNPDIYGSAAIAQKLDSYGDNMNYYLVQANGVGHVISPDCDGNFTIENNFKQMWFYDFYRFMLNAVLNPSYKNQIHKILTPINSTLNYCEALDTNSCNGQGQGLLNFHTIETILNPNKICFPIPGINTPSLNLTTKPWVDIFQAYNSCIYPSILTNCDSNVICYNGALNNGRLANSVSTKENDQKEIIADYKIKVYPNPAVNQIAIETNFEESEIIKSVEIYDVSGKNVNINFSDKNVNLIDLSEFSSGSYFIRIITDKENYVHPFIINK